MDVKEQGIIAYCNKYDYVYVKIENEIDIDLVYNAVINDVFEENVSAIVNNYYGVYYMTRNNINGAIKCYSKASDEGYLPAIKNLNIYYNKQNDVANHIKYLRIAADLGDCDAIKALIDFYEREDQQDELMFYFTKALQLGYQKILNKFISENRHNENKLKYIIVAADFDHIGAMCISVRRFVNDFDIRIKYCLKLITLDKQLGQAVLVSIFQDCIKQNQKNNVIYCYQLLMDLDAERAKDLLSHYYYTIGDYKNMIKTVDIDYILNCRTIKEDQNILIELFNLHPEIFNDELYIKRILSILAKLTMKEDFDDKLITIIEHINIKYFDDVSKFLVMYKKLLNEKINLLDLHFNYSPDSKGYLEAKEDFIERLT